MIRTALDHVPALEQLLRNAAWARRLARSLVADDAGADDLVQDAWMSALRRPPDTSEPVRPWLRTVLRNQLFNSARGDRRRATREAEAGGASETASPEELVGRVEILKILVVAVLALKEPYRQTVLLRYFEGLPAAEIAARSNVPPATVRGRLKVALDLLREALAVREQGRFDWVAAIRKLLDAPAILPGVATRPPAPPPARGWPAKVILAGVLVLVAIPTVRRLVDRRARDRRQVEASLSSSPARQLDEMKPADDVRFAAENSGHAADRTTSAEGASIAALGDRSSGQAASTGIIGTTRAAARTTALPGARPPVVVADENGNLSNVAVKVVKGLAPPAVPTFGPADTIVFRLSPVGFMPRVRMARVGQLIAIASADFRARDLGVWQADKVLFEGSARPDPAPVLVAHAPAGEVVRIQAGAGLADRAFVVTTEHPFGAVSDHHGRFSLPGLPPGRYTLEAWHEYFGATRSEVTVPPHGAASDVFAFESPQSAPPSRSAPGSCRIARSLPNPIVKACGKGGVAEAKREMKKLVGEAKTRGRTMRCEGCHANLDDYTLVEGGEAKLVDLLRFVDDERAASAARQ